MSTTPTPHTGLSAATFLQILQIAMIALSVIPATAPEALAAEALIGIIQKAMAGYQAASGQPLDLTKIPLETPVG
jgi:hypothetical protein